MQSIKPTPKQLDYAKKLIEKCGYDVQIDYPDLENWSRGDVSKLIDELKAEMGWD